MNARTFIIFMFLLLVFTTGLLVFTAPRKGEIQKEECPAGTPCNDNLQVQAADGSIIWESVSRHLLSAVQQ